MRARLLFASVLCLALLAACGGTSSSTKSTATTSSGSPAGASVTIQSIAYSPSTVTAKVGDTITVTNKDGIDHSFTADDGSFDTGKFSSGSKTVKVNKAGSIAFHCVVHSSMKGTIQVS